MAPGTVGDSNRLHGAAQLWKVHLALTLVQCFYAGATIVQKFTFTKGMNPIVFSVYRDIVCLSTLTPLAFFSERGRRTPLDWKILGQMVFLGFAALYCGQFTLTYGISLAPAAFGSLLGIGTPIFVFLISAATGVEEIQWTKRAGQAKVLGILSAVCGGALIPLYRGPLIVKSLRDPGSNLLSELPQDIHGILPPAILSNLQIENWQLGGFLLILTDFLYAVFWTLQTHTLKRYPAPVSIAAFAYISAFMMLTPTALLLFRDEWAVPQPSTIIAILYVGLCSSGANFALQSWASVHSGPVLLTSYTPLQSVVIIAMAYLFFGESIHLGSVLGFLLITTGLFLITWGKVTSQKDAGHLVSALPSTLDGSAIVKEDSNLEERLLG